MQILRRSLITAFPAIVVAMAFFVLFIDKAFTIDDRTFLLMARHMLEDPLHYSSFEFVFHGFRGRASGVVSGPVMPAMLVPSVLAGGAEWLAHLAMLPVFVIGLVSSAALALRLGMSQAGAFWVALLVGTSPAVLGMATTSMPDVPAMSFGALAVERLLAFRAERRVSTGISVAVALALAVLSRPQLAALFICVLPLLLDKWPSSPRALVAAVFDRAFLTRIGPLAGAVVLLAVVTAVMRDPVTGSNLAGSTKQSIEFWALRVNLSHLPAQWVLSFPLGIAWTMLHGRRMATSPRCWAWAVIGIELAALVSTVTGEVRSLLWQAPVTALGMAVLADVISDAWRRRDLVEISLAAWLLIAWPAALYAHLPAKFLVPSAPAMALLIVRHAEQAARPMIMRVLLGGSAFAGLVLGLLIARADAAFAEVGRIGGRVIAEEIKRGERVWYDGGISFSWYADQAGARPMTWGAPLPAPGDVVVQGLSGGRIEQCPNKTLLRKMLFHEPGGRITGEFANFYTGEPAGPGAPWQWGRGVFGRIDVWRIESCELGRPRSQ